MQDATEKRGKEEKERERETEKGGGERGGGERITEGRKNPKAGGGSQRLAQIWSDQRFSTPTKNDLNFGLVECLLRLSERILKVLSHENFKLIFLF